MAFSRPRALAPARRDRRPRDERTDESFVWSFALPRGIRHAAAHGLGDFENGTVLDVGCGTGRFFRYLEAAGGPHCRIVGIDSSDAALAQASGRCARRGWSNVALVHGDALVAPMPDSVAAAVFSLSYWSMARRREILARVWQRVRPGGRVVIMDAKAPSGAIGRLVSAGLRRFGLSTGAPEPSVTAPWSDLASLGATVEVQEWAFGSYFVAVGEKNRT
jgi:ubiquinone/menaquinone biosynthesis C-methylase UbiE